MKSSPLCTLPGQVAEKLFRSFFLLVNLVHLEQKLPFLSFATLFKAKEKKNITEKITSHPEMALLEALDCKRDIKGTGGHLLLRSDNCPFVTLITSDWEGHLKCMFQT